MCVREKIPIVTHYIDKKTKKETRYSPYQEDLNKLEAVTIEFDGEDAPLFIGMSTSAKIITETKLRLRYGLRCT